MKGQRKRTWIDPFQTGLLVRIAVYLLAFQTVAWAFFALCDQANAALAARGAGVAYLRSSLARSLLSLLLLAPPLALEAVRFAHRLVGPLYRFRKALQAIAAGERVALVQLRKGDLLLDFQDDFNAMLRRLEQQGHVLLTTPEPATSGEVPQPVGGVAPAAGHPRA